MRIKALILAIICLLSFGCKDRELKTEDVKEQLDSMTMKLKDNESMEYMLASIDAGHYILRDDVSIEKFRTLLKQLDEKFVEDETQIGDISVSTKFQLRDVGIQESLLNIMEGMNQLFSDTQEDIKYAEYTTLYLGLRKKEYLHDNAIKGLKLLFQNRDIY